MKYKFEGETVDDVISAMDEMVDCISSIMSKMDSIQANINANNEGAAISKVNEILDSTTDTLKVMGENVDDFKENIVLFKDSIMEIDEEEIYREAYEIDIDDVKSYANNVMEIVSDADYDNLSRNYKSKIEDYNSKVRTYNMVNYGLNLELEYKDDFYAQSYIKNKRNEIADEINRQKHNASVFEEALRLISTFKGQL